MGVEFCVIVSWIIFVCINRFVVSGDFKLFMYEVFFSYFKSVYNFEMLMFIRDIKVGVESKVCIGFIFN